jgi:molybdopterin synthase catalytic subunit
LAGRVVSARLQDEALDPSSSLGSVSDPACGGLAMFAGVVRDSDGGRTVIGLDYEAHPSAAEVLGEVCERAAALPGVVAVSAIHRLGHLEIGELAVVVAVSSPHRAEAIHACQWHIATLKQEVPIWKRQQYADGSTDWVGAL